MWKDGIFGDLFDFNRDGELDTFERAAEFSYVQSLMDNDDDFDDFDEDEDDFDADDNYFENDDWD